TGIPALRPLACLQICLQLERRIDPTPCSGAQPAVGPRGRLTRIPRRPRWTRRQSAARGTPMLFHLIVGSAALAVLLALPVGRAMVALAILAVLWLVRIAMVLLTVALLGAIIGTLIWVSLRALVGPLSQMPAPVNAGLVVAVMLAAFWWLDVRARKK